MTRVLITGISGFIGQALASAINKQGFTVRGTVRKKSNVTQDFVEQCEMGDMSPDTDWGLALDGIDVLIHLAARVHVMKEAENDPLAEFRLINTTSTLTLARQAAESGVKRFIYLSSIKVNGESTPLNNPFTEKNIPSPIDPYGISKFETEEGLFQLADKTGMEVVCIRPVLVYGPGVKANFHSMMKWLYRGVPLPFGAINNKRSLVSLDNLVDFIITCVDHPAASNECFLVSDDEDLSTTELLHRVTKAIGRQSHLLPINQHILQFGLNLIGKKALAQRLCGSLQVDISKAKTLLNWTPPFSVDEGLRLTVEYFLKTRT